MSDEEENNEALAAEGVEAGTLQGKTLTAMVLKL